MPAVYRSKVHFHSPQRNLVQGKLRLTLLSEQEKNGAFFSVTTREAFTSRELGTLPHDLTTSESNQARRQEPLLKRLGPSHEREPLCMLRFMGKDRVRQVPMVEQIADIIRHRTQFRPEPWRFTLRARRCAGCPGSSRHRQDSEAGAVAHKVTKASL